MVHSVSDLLDTKGSWRSQGYFNEKLPLSPFFGLCVLMPHYSNPDFPNPINEFNKTSE